MTVNRLKARLLREESGFTLVEMMVTMMIMIIVLFALYGIFDMSLRVFSFSNNKVEAVEQARVGLERMEREIRAAYPYNKPADTRVLTTMARNEIAFGNDLDGDYAVETGEVIRYRLLKESFPVDPCDPGDSDCKVYRSKGSSFSRLVEFVRAPTTSPAYEGGLRFTYLKADGPDAGTDLDPTTNTADEPYIKAVRIELDVSVDEGSRDEATQTLVTEVSLRNREE
jgi:prepilin-type N-terminal cleavage/methylation domain-containing protein